MAYTDVLTLTEAKIYLRIDDTQNETDAEIRSLINAAFRYIEKHTNSIVSNQTEKEYVVKNGCVRVYDHPINSVVKGLDDEGSDVTLTYKTNYYKQDKTLYTLFTGIDSSVEKLVLNVGYVNVANVPDDLIQLASIMVKVMYYEQESNLSFKEMLPAWANSILESNRRFTI